MKRTHACLFLLLTAFCLTGCGLNFQDFSSPDGLYSVKLPGKPVRTGDPSGLGESWEAVGRSYSYGVLVMDLQQAGKRHPEGYVFNLDLGVKSLTDTFRATLNSNTNINLNGFEGREIECSIPAGTNSTTGRPMPASSAVMRIYVVNTKLVVLQARSASTINKGTPDVKTFFDSFKLNAAGSTPSTNLAGQPGGATPAGATAGTDPALAAAGATPAGLPNSNPGVNPLPDSNPPADQTNPASTETTPASITSLPNSNPSASSTEDQPGVSRSPVTEDTKLEVGDIVSVEFANQWTDLKVERVDAEGFVQVRRLTPPTISSRVPRKSLYKVSGAAAEVAMADPSESEPSNPPQTSSLPQSKSSGSTNSDAPSLPKSVAATTAKPRSAGVAKPVSSEPKAETVKSAGLVSLDGASVDDLLKVIGRKNEHRKALAAEKLRDHSEATPNPAVAKKIVDLLKSSNELTVRAAIAQALEKWASPEIHDDVVKNLTGGTTEVRQSMIRILAATNAEDAADCIANCLSDKDDRKVATETLISLGEPAQEAVIKMLNHRDSKVKTAACDILKEIGTADSIPALTKATSDWTGTDRLAARKALKALEAKK